MIIWSTFRRGGDGGEQNLSSSNVLLPFNTGEKEDLKHLS